MKKFLEICPAFYTKNYRIYFIGQLISLIGTWLHIVAEGWLVLKLTDSAFWVGAITGLHTLPILLFSLFSGAIVDRFSNKKILYITQSGAFILALILGILTITESIQLWQLAILVFGLGMMQVFDLPARQSFTTEMLEKEYLSSALAMNAGIFNAARAIGPAIAGLLLSVISPGAVFILNAFSFFAGIILLRFIECVKILPEDKSHPLKAIKSGLSYTFSHRRIKYMLILIGITAVFAWSYSAIFPTIVQDVFKKGAESLGFLHSAVGAGAVLGAIVVSAYSRKLPEKLFIFGGTLTIIATTILFTFSNMYLGYVFLFVMGFALVVQFSTINTFILHNVGDNMKGRVMSIFTFMSTGLLPLGNFEIGGLSELIDPFWALRINAALVLVATGCIYILYNRKEPTKI